jgi:hypothetical protein
MVTSKGLLQGDAVEEAKGTDGLVEDAPGGVLLQQVELVKTAILGAELFRGAAEVAGEADDRGEVGFQGPRAVVAQLQVVEKALA